MFELQLNSQGGLIMQISNGPSAGINLDSKSSAEALRRLSSHSSLNNTLGLTQNTDNTNLEHIPELPTEMKQVYANKESLQSRFNANFIAHDTLGSIGENISNVKSLADEAVETGGNVASQALSSLFNGLYTEIQEKKQEAEEQVDNLNKNVPTEEQIILPTLEELGIPNPEEVKDLKSLSSEAQQSLDKIQSAQSGFEQEMDALGRELDVSDVHIANLQASGSQITDADIAQASADKAKELIMQPESLTSLYQSGVTNTDILDLL